VATTATQVPLTLLYSLEDKAHATHPPTLAHTHKPQMDSLVCLLG
jgi:hypothetical protein